MTLQTSQCDQKKVIQEFVSAVKNRDTLHTCTHVYTRNYDTSFTSPASNRLSLSYTDNLA